MDVAKDLSLTGFSLPGKPGFACVEGVKNDCNEFFQHLKHMTRKNLSLVKEETVELSNPSGFRRFSRDYFSCEKRPGQRIPHGHGSDFEIS